MVTTDEELEEKIEKMRVDGLSPDESFLRLIQTEDPKQCIRVLENMLRKVDLT